MSPNQYPYIRQIKNVLRAPMIDEHLKDQLKLKTSTLEPNIPMLVQQKQSQTNKIL